MCTGHVRVTVGNACVHAQVGCYCKGVELHGASAFSLTRSPFGTRSASFDSTNSFLRLFVRKNQSIFLLRNIKNDRRVGKQDPDTSRGLRALSTCPPSFPQPTVRHLRDVTRGNSWSFLSYLLLAVRCSATFLRLPFSY